MSLTSTLLTAATLAIPAVLAAPAAAPASSPAHYASTTTAPAPMNPRAAPEWYEGPWYNFPSSSTWLSYDELFAIHSPYMLYTGSLQSDVDGINYAIGEVSASTGIDNRVLLAMIMQESHGYVGAPTTYSWEGIPTAGLLQCSGCTGFPDQVGLSQDQITAMVQGGADHYLGNVANWGSLGTEETWYPALREYNSGSVNPDNLSDGLGATDAYVSDVSQRMTGWAD